jgi:hypothetical protein
MEIKNQLYKRKKANFDQKKNNRLVLGVLLGSGVLFVILCVCFYFAAESSLKALNTQNLPGATPQVSSETLFNQPAFRWTKAKFENLKNGTTYSDIVSQVGDPQSLVEKTNTKGAAIKEAAWSNQRTTITLEFTRNSGGVFVLSRKSLKGEF